MWRSCPFRGSLAAGRRGSIWRRWSSAEAIARLAASLGLDVIRPECVVGPGPLRSGNSRRSLAPDTAISSTRIRKELEEGRVEEAAAMLGYPYRLHGVVVAGNRLGRTIGFPTANMQLYEPLKLVPANGVYQVKVESGDAGPDLYRHVQHWCSPYRGGRKRPYH